MIFYHLLLFQTSLCQKLGNLHYKGEIVTGVESWDVVSIIHINPIMESVQQLKNVTSTLSDRFAEIKAEFDDDWVGSIDKFDRYHLIEMFLHSNEVCSERLDEETGRVERRAEEFSRFFSTNHGRRTIKRSAGFGSIIDVMPHMFGFGSSLLNYLKETETSRKVQHIEDKFSQYVETSNGKFGKLNNDLVVFQDQQISINRKFNTQLRDLQDKLIM